MADRAHYNVRRGASHAREIGITQRTTPLAFSWTGDERLRFSDFQVNEINKDGNVVHLHYIGLDGRPPQDVAADAESDLRPAERSVEDQAGTTPNQKLEAKESMPVSVPLTEADGTLNTKSQEPAAADIPPEDVKALASLTGDKFANGLVHLYQNREGSEDNRNASIASDPVQDRPMRGQIHNEVRRIFSSKIETSTNASGAIVATLAAPRRGARRSRGARGQREEKPSGEYLHFTLYKENRDTMDAVNQIARMVRVKPQVIGYAGTKDRRASTAQRCSIRHMRQKALAGVNGRLRGIWTGDYQYEQSPIHLGLLSGNQFTITLKNCKAITQALPNSLVDRVEMMRANAQTALDHMYQHGWINYFGHQRFGTHRVGTHEIGKLILGDKWEQAVDALLAYDPEIAAKAAAGEIPEEASKRDDYARNHACMIFKTEKNIEKAASLMPPRFAAETCILRHLGRLGKASHGDFSGSLTHITRGLRSMYLHAYQSHVWNHAASRRWELHRDQVVKGDLIMVEQGAAGGAASDEQDEDEVDGLMDAVDEGPDSAAALRARPLTEAEASSGRFSIHDVVLPSPGYDVVYPDNEIGRFYEDFMGREQNGSLDPHKMRRRRREFSLPGRYRKLMARFLAQPSIQLQLYADDAQQLHPTDLDLIQAAVAAAAAASDTCTTEKRQREAETVALAPSKKRKTDGLSAPVAADDPRPTEDQQEAVADEASRIAAVVKFQLGSSAYATVALRELMGDLEEE